jgi:hypothetical protein
MLRYRCIVLRTQQEENRSAEFKKIDGGEAILLTLLLLPR